jgi:hypothetical protein
MPFASEGRGEGSKRRSLSICYNKLVKNNCTIVPVAVAVAVAAEVSEAVLPLVSQAL